MLSTGRAPANEVPRRDNLLLARRPNEPAGPGAPRGAAASSGAANERDHAKVRSIGRPDGVTKTTVRGLAPGVLNAAAAGFRGVRHTSGQWTVFVGMLGVFLLGAVQGLRSSSRGRSGCRGAGVELPRTDGMTALRAAVGKDNDPALEGAGKNSLEVVHCGGWMDCQIKTKAPSNQMAISLSFCTPARRRRGSLLDCRDVMRPELDSLRQLDWIHKLPIHFLPSIYEAF